MAVPRSPTPGRGAAGFTTDWPYGPMADSGYGNPFYYHAFSDDFDNALGVAGLYTVSAGGAGTIAHSAGDGGLALFTTAGASTNFESIQLPAADYTLPQGTLAGKKFFWMARLQLSDITNSAFIAGVTNITATPFTAIADGIYFTKASGGTVLNIVSAIASTLTTTAIPTSAYTFTNATNIDLAFYIDWYGNLNAFTSANMVGFAPQSGTGATVPTRGRCLQVSNLSLSTANLSPILAVQTGVAAVKTMTVDFHLVQKER
jgi:hypothetical protein